jgi:hypothetical protein
MERTHRTQHRFRLPAMLSSKQVVLLALIIDLFPAPLFAQRPRMSYKTAPVMVPTTPDDRVVVDKGDSSRATGENKMCSIQLFPGMANSVSVMSLQIPRKAQKEYERACTALKSTRARDACSRASGADPSYLPAYLCLAEIAGRGQEWQKPVAIPCHLPGTAACRSTALSLRNILRDSGASGCGNRLLPRQAQSETLASTIKETQMFA